MLLCLIAEELAGSCAKTGCSVRRPGEGECGRVGKRQQEGKEEAGGIWGMEQKREAMMEE